MDNIKVEIKELKKYFEDLLGLENVKTNEPMSKHTTFKTGGPAWYYLTPENGEQIAKIIDLCNKTGVKYHMHGNGSNVFGCTAITWCMVCHCQVIINGLRYTHELNGTAI